jgi:hypothetical protein
MKNKNILKWIVPVLCVVGFSSCLKNKNEQPDFSTATPVVELPVGSPKGDGTPNSLEAAFTQNAVPSDYFIMVNYAANEANASDLAVTLSNTDAAVLTRYNTANGTNFTIMPTSAYTAPTVVTIPAGQRKVQVPIKITTTALDPTVAYAIPFTITNASGVTISKNFTSLVLIVRLKNMYDGVYTATGTMVDATNAAFTGDYPREYQLITSSANSVALFAPGFNGGIYGHPFLNAGSGTYYGNFAPIFQFNSNDEVVAVTNYYGQGNNSSTRSARLAPGVNKWTVRPGSTGTRTLEVSYYLVQAGTDRTLYTEKFVFKGDRP